jgi:M6 family metalloprotease-like protein
MRARLFLAVLFTFSTVTPGWSVRHLNPSTYPPEAGQCKARGISAARLRSASSLHAMIIGTSTGAKNVAVIIVRFPSASSTLTTQPGVNVIGSGTQNQIQSLTNIDHYFDQMKAYYSEVSYGKITLTFKFFGDNTTHLNGDTTAVIAGSHQLGHAMEYYGCGDEYQGCNGVTTPTPGQVTPNGNYLIKDALVTARATHSNTPTSATSGGLFDAVIVVHAGNGNETTSGNGDIWSIFYSQDDVIGSVSSAGFTEGDVVPETQASGITSPLGVMCHEFGHELGLPDLYNTGSAGGTSVVGDWEIMDSGPFTGAGANPSHPGAWDKVYLGWSTPQVIPARGSPTLQYVETNANSMIKIPINGHPNEYFLVEYRSRSSGAQFDHNVPGDGLIFWHVDDSITSSRGLYVTDQSVANTVNTGTPNYGVTIVPANGIPISENRGSSGNAFVTGSSFFTPKSDTYGGQPSGISVLNITVSGGITNFDVLNLIPSDSQTILKVINYPNPAGKGYAHTKGEGNTTLQFQLSRPATDYRINIYTPSGDLVRKYGPSEIRANGDRSLDRKFVYEVDWDLKNGDGKQVAPGAYIILIRADGQSKSNKAVVIR